MAYKGAAQHSETRDKVAAALVIIGSLIVAVSGFFVWLDILGSDLTGYQLAPVSPPVVYLIFKTRSLVTVVTISYRFLRMLDGI